MSRRTLATPAEVQGVGLHLGLPCRLRFTSAVAGSGRTFVRMDLPGAPEFRANAASAVLAERRTQLGEGEGALHTVEHVLSAVAGAGVDDLRIEMDGPEPPIMDGSAAPFLDALVAAGFEEQPGAPSVLTLAEPVVVEDGESRYEAHPADRLELDVTIEFPHPLIGVQRWVGEITPDVYSSELAAARTFGFVHEVEYLRSRGLIQGASTENAVVLDVETAGLVGCELRWPDEFVRHKAMDCVGDLALAEARIHARVVAVRPSHRGTVLLVREMVRQGMLAAA